MNGVLKILTLTATLHSDTIIPHKAPAISNRQAAAYVQKHPIPLHTVRRLKLRYLFTNTFITQYPKKDLSLKYHKFLQFANMVLVINGN